MTVNAWQIDLTDDTERRIFKTVVTDKQTGDIWSMDSGYDCNRDPRVDLRGYPRDAGDCILPFGECFKKHNTRDEMIGEILDEVKDRFDKLSDKS